ncbi:MAG: SRPBCC family protein [Chloroflexota bacterium]|nr:SRPBCC family protein [Chloroflexota bacterium]MDP9471914.1 SRPBCC family protein [Chloroflexota bacterium]
MAKVEKDIHVNVPVSRAYEIWTNFEAFPNFMQNVTAIDQAERQLHWIANIRGKREEWDAQITEMTPNQSVSWRSTSGTPNSGTVRFEPHEGGTHVFVTIEYERNPLEAVGDTLTQAVAREVQQDLDNFKYFAEMGEPVVGRREENLAEQTGP